jgi:hypothetical protein
MQGPTTPTNAADEMRDLARMDSLDDYFMLNSPPESPEQRQRELVSMGDSPQDAQQQQQQQQRQQQQQHASINPFDLPFGYFATNEIAPQGNNVQTSTLNFTVDRSNAVSSDHDGSAMVFGRLLPGTQKDIEELLKLDEKDLNLSELFLQSKHRTSLNYTYQAKGALKGHDNELYRPRMNSLSSSFLEDPENKTNSTANNAQAASNKEQQNMNSGRNAASQQQSMDFDLDVDVEPTPLSEIKAKSQFRGHASSEMPRLTSQQLEHHEYRQNRQDVRMQHGSNYYPFGRAYQLPIPTMPATSPIQADHQEVPSLQDAVATAAALALAQKEQDAARGGSHSPMYNHPEHVPPHSSQPGSQSSWHQTDHHTHHQSHSPRAEAQPPQDPLTNAQHQHSLHSHHDHQAPPHPSYQQQHQHHSSSPSYSHQPHHLTTPMVSGGPNHHGLKMVGPYTKVQQEGNANSSIPDLLRRAGVSTSSKPAPAPAPVASYLPRRGDHTQRTASSAHSAPKGVMTEAATQRRGYTGYHKPATIQASSAYHHAQFSNYTGEPKSSVHATESTPTLTQASSSKVAPAKMAESSNSSVDGAPPLAAAEAHAHADNAYERKKQRAKDARVKLNESIERLHVSMGVAGTESKKRAEQLRNFMMQAGREDESHTDHQAFELMDSCVKTAESAKKWDRPNFVGSAATMIQCLNSQCEILMKELLEYEETARMQARGRLSPPLAPAEGSNTSMMHGESSGRTQQPQGQDDAVPGSKRHLDASSFDENAAEYTAGKLRRLTSVEEEKKEASSANDVGGNPVSPESGLPVYCTPGGPTIRLGDFVMDLIAAFLDPGSLIQCMSVCKTWNNGRCFAKQEIWESLCIMRFGISNFRQWRENHTDDDEDERALLEDNGQGGDSKLEQRIGIRTYRGMDEQLIMPWVQRDGRNHVLLGKTQLPNAEVSAWLYLVERSNGETMRSVRRPQPTLPSSRNSGVYTSLPVVELRIVFQNTGGRITKKSSTGNTRDAPVVMKSQRLVVDASTRRRGEELLEIDWDERFAKRLTNADGSDYVPDTDQPSDVLCTLKLFETVVVVASIHARRCSTSSKFMQRANFLKLLLSVKGTTQPLIIPIGKEKGGKDSSSRVLSHSVCETKDHIRDDYCGKTD